MFRLPAHLPERCRANAISPPWAIQPRHLNRRETETMPWFPACARRGSSMESAHGWACLGCATLVKHPTSLVLSTTEFHAYCSCAIGKPRRSKASRPPGRRSATSKSAARPRMPKLPGMSAMMSLPHGPRQPAVMRCASPAPMMRAPPATVPRHGPGGDQVPTHPCWCCINHSF